ncbi:centrosomal protein of 170 kDa isoform X1 [Rhinichthys klamathensis goyatoka]|uniref:centrosomal protein of 170 kDa isoform X1 n=1 Tax=Rhinichthys klamathensis goyatoka TaxID=3034132 RepID=UPI0024B5E70B|nr:centrosomal protein of 170 kDa isoform X1 [Rhinichthys klamathensis goyatoka]XP_056123109.1 centrosomal protein of 170 kDa isoform X1 [Rhinichthys klamathensis goyatoka]
MSLTSWFLVSSGGTRHRLPREMIFVGRDDCELMLQSRSVDKQHAVINYEEAADEHKVKDLGSLNGTFVNDERIQEQQYITLKMDDKLRFGYDTNLFTVVRAELHVPEEALKHEKFTSQLQLTKKPSPSGETTKSPEVKGAEGGKDAEVRPSDPAPKAEEKVLAGDIAMLHRGTPLYGQPSWWGDGDADDENSVKHDAKASEQKQARCEAGSKDTVTKQQVGPGITTQNLGTQEPSYFEIPCKETPPVVGDTGESLPTSLEAVASASTIPASEGGAHGHASFTIEFDTMASGKGKERNSKGAPDHRQWPKRGAGEELSALQAAMVAAEVKVADWLAQNELPLACSESVAEDDGDSVKSDVPVQLRSLRGSKHEDGTQSDSENALGEQLSSRRAFPQERYRGRQGVQKTEGLFCGREDLFQHKPSSVAKKMAPVGGEVGKTTNSSSPQKANVPREQSTGSQETPSRGHVDDQSDRGTYTIELENGNAEEEEARRMIDKVFGVEDNQALTKLRFPKYQKDRGTICPISGSMETRQTGYVGAEVLPDDLVVVGGPRWVSQWATLAASHIRTDPEGSGAEPTVLSTDEKVDINASERKRRTLPHLPFEDSAMDPLAPGGTRNEFRRTLPSTEKQDLERQEKVDQLNRISKTGQRVSGMSSAIMGVDRSKVNKPTPPRNQNKVKQQGAHTRQIEKKQEDGRRKKADVDREKTGKPLLRQESFTVERPSGNVPLELIPCIDGPGASTQHREMAVINESIDAATMLKDSEAVAAFLETTLSDLADPPSYSLEGSFSPESDIDTTSTVSQAGREGMRKTTQRKRSAGGPGRETANKNTSATERKGKAHPSGSAGSRAWTSLDLTDDDLSSSLAQDVTLVKRPQGRGQNISSKTEPTSGKAKGAKTTVAPAPATSKPTTLPRPRPTRSSLLRRARLGEASDTDLADVDRMSVASEASTASSASRPSAGRRTLSRIEALAQPRRQRVCSPSARSDSEATSGKIRGFVPRPAPESALRLGLRSTTASSSVGVPRARANSASKLPDKCPGAPYVQSTPAAGGRWRRVPIEYASTSEDEYGSNRHPTQHSRPRPMAPRVTQLGGSAPATPSPGGISMLRNQSSREQDDYMRDWTAHSEEIARISQDLAKDLAMLAREIHDVAGEIDSVSPSSAPAASVEDRVFEDVLGSAPEISSRGVELRPRGAISSQDPRAIRRRTWSRDEGVLDSLLLASVSQLSAKIKQAMEKTANKIRILFKDKDRKWEEIESKLRAENEVPLLKTSNQEISSILQNLKRVERQLLVIDIMVDPDGTLDALSSLGLTSPLMAENSVSPGSQGPAGNQAAEVSAYSEVAERDLGLQEKSKEQNTAHQN